MTVNGITINLSATTVAYMHLQALLPFRNPSARMGRIRIEAEAPQPKLNVTLQASSVDLLAVFNQEAF